MLVPLQSFQFRFVCVFFSSLVFFKQCFFSSFSWLHSPMKVYLVKYLYVCLLLTWMVWFVQRRLLRPPEIEFIRCNLFADRCNSRFTTAEDERTSRAYKLKSHFVRTHYFHQISIWSTLRIDSSTLFFFLYSSSYNLFSAFVCVFDIANGRWLINCHNESPHNQVFLYFFLFSYAFHSFGFSVRFVHRRLNFFFCLPEARNWIWIN